MAEWSVKPTWKKSIIERNYLYKDDNTLMVETGWRWGEFTVYTDDDNPPKLEAGVDMYNCDYESEMVETSDGCWEEHDMDECDEETQAWLEEFFDEGNSWLDLEEHGWSQGDCEMIIDCDMEMTRTDIENGPTFNTGDLDEVETAEWPVERPQEGPSLTAPAKWPFETAFVKAEEPEEPEMTDWFPGDVNPAYTGDYEVCTKLDENWPFPSRANWDGKKWNVADVAQWRGLAQDPSL